jgi:RNA 3'-terminal phosphate cyclase (ATP)
MPLHNTNSNSQPPNKSAKGKSRDNTSIPESAIPNWALKTPGLITLDGRTLEGGGQLVRVALTLSALLSIPVYIHHIRGKRASWGKAGGLKESHLAALEFLQDACGAEVYGAEVGGTEVVFLPGRGGRRQEQSDNADSNGRHVIELRNPGSAWLIFQAIYPFLLFRGRENGADAGTDTIQLTIRGGTNVSMSMSAEYVQQVFLPTMEKIGLHGTVVRTNKRGWTHGRIEVGEVEVVVTPLPATSRLTGFKIGGTGETADRNMVKKITISAMASPAGVLEYLVEVALERAREQFPEAEEVEVEVKEDSGDSRRMYLMLVAHLLDGWRIGRDWLFDGKVKKTDGKVIAKQMVQRVAMDLSVEVERGGYVDEFMQDQLVIFQALAAGPSEVDAGIGREEGTEHTKTVKWVVEQMLGKEMFAGVVVDGCALTVGSKRTTEPAQGDDDALTSKIGEVSLEG